MKKKHVVHKWLESLLRNERLLNESERTGVLAINNLGKIFQDSRWRLHEMIRHSAMTDESIWKATDRNEKLDVHYVYYISIVYFMGLYDTKNGDAPLNSKTECLEEWFNFHDKWVSFCFVKQRIVHPLLKRRRAGMWKLTHVEMSNANGIRCACISIPIHQRIYWKNKYVHNKY